MIGPPYFRLDESELLAHFEAAARACAPVPFYVYELKAASGYAVPVDVLHRLRERAPNFVGMKVSDAPWESFAPYLIEGLDIFVGPESLISQGVAAGAVGAVSALATAFPELVAKAVRTGDLEDTVWSATCGVRSTVFRARLPSSTSWRGAALPSVEPYVRRFGN